MTPAASPALATDATGRLTFTPAPAATATASGAGEAPAPAPVAVSARLCFPWSYPDTHVSLRDADGTERTLVADPAALPDGPRAALRSALADAHLTLDITRVLAIDTDFQLRIWRVETSSGPRSFLTHFEDYPHTLPGGAILIQDLSGDLYRIPQPAALDPLSRRLLFTFTE